MTSYHIFVRQIAHSLDLFSFVFQKTNHITMTSHQQHSVTNHGYLYSFYDCLLVYWPIMRGIHGDPWIPLTIRWRHQMETFSALLAFSAGNSPVAGEFPAQRPLTRGFDVFFDLRLNKPLSKQSRGWWSETPSSPLWRLCNELPVERNAFPLS